MLMEGFKLAYTVPVTDCNSWNKIRSSALRLTHTHTKAARISPSLNHTHYPQINVKKGQQLAWYDRVFVRNRSLHMVMFRPVHVTDCHSVTGRNCSASVAEFVNTLLCVCNITRTTIQSAINTHTHTHWEGKWNKVVKRGRELQPYVRDGVVGQEVAEGSCISFRRYCGRNTGQVFYCCGSEAEVTAHICRTPKWKTLKDFRVWCLRRLCFLWSVIVLFHGLWSRYWTTFIYIQQ